MTTTLTTCHDTFTIEREYAVDAATVFAAWADPDLKHQWFAGPDGWIQREYELDATIGGSETNRLESPDGLVITYSARYFDIVDGERLVYTYEMYEADKRISVSLTTVELAPTATGTRLVLTEQGAFLDDHDQPEFRRAGSEQLLDNLTGFLVP